MFINLPKCLYLNTSYVVISVGLSGAIPAGTTYFYVPGRRIVILVGEKEEAGEEER